VDERHRREHDRYEHGYPVATGAGSGARLVLGTAVVFGMSVATLIGILIIPVFYVLVQSLEERLLGKRPAPETQS
jgi:hypothetical protein